MPEKPTVSFDGKEVSKALQVTKWKLESWIGMLDKAEYAASSAEKKYRQDWTQLQNMIREYEQKYPVVVETRSWGEAVPAVVPRLEAI